MVIQKIYFLLAKIVLIIAAFMFSFQYLLSQNIGSPKSMALGSTGVAGARNIDAISINPANLSCENKERWIFTIIPSISFDAGNSMINFGTYKKYFTGSDNGSGTKDPIKLTNENKADIINGFPKNGIGRAMVAGGVDIFSIAYYNEKLTAGFGFKIREKSVGKIDLPVDAFKLLLYGNSRNYNYNFDFSSIYSYWLREFALAFGKDIYNKKEVKVNIGASFKYLSGYSFFESQKVKSNFVTTDTSLEGNILLQARYASADFMNSKAKYNLFASPAGRGFAADLGVSWIVSNVFSVGLSIVDIGYIKWNKNVEEIYVDTVGKIMDITNDDQYKPFEDIIENHKYKKESFSTILPATLRLGGELSLQNLDYFKKRKYIPIIISTELSYTYFPDIQKPHFFLVGLGIELLPVSWLPIRMGVSAGSLPVSISFGGGINTGSFDLDLGLGNILAPFGVSFSQSASISLGMKFKI
jgi:hypothetical protein